MCRNLRLPARLRLWLITPLLGLLVACTRPEVITALTDAQWGLAAGCASTWVPAADCQIATDGLTAALAVAHSAPANEVKAAVVTVIQSTEAKLAIDSKARPFIDYLVVFLG
jgi:hypothetical protein